MVLEVKPRAANLMVQGAESRANDTEEKATASKVVAWVTKAKVECESKVAEAFPKLKLDYIVLAKPKLEGEGVEETEAAKIEMILIDKIKADEAREVGKDKATSRAKGDFIWETITLVMVETNMAMEAISIGLAPAVAPKK